MHVNVRYFLKRCLAISKKEIDTFTSHAGLTNRSRSALCDCPEMPSCLFIQVCKIGSVSFGNDHRMPRSNWNYGHDPQYNIIFIEDAARAFTSNDLTKNTALYRLHL